MLALGASRYHHDVIVFLFGNLVKYTSSRSQLVFEAHVSHVSFIAQKRLFSPHTYSFNVSIMFVRRFLDNDRKKIG